ncbi:MAG: recombinase family protein [Patescibacteria group bacterium]
MRKAIVYSRVSSQKQVVEGNGIDSQKLRCIQYAKLKGYEVIKSFKDEAVSGANADRPGFNALLTYIDNHSSGEFVVIVDDISRLARDMKVHLQLRKNLKDRKVALESPNFKFEENPEGTFIEHVIAAKSQLDREQNRRQVIQKQKARFELGFWALCPPPGLINIKHPTYGKVLIPHEPKASIFKEAIEKYRDGYLNTYDEVRNFINDKFKPLNLKLISINGVERILRNLLYAGWIEYKPWGIMPQKAKHDGFITKETYDQVQIKLQNKSRATLRKDYNLDFPLRGFISCDSCKKPYTASWHKGRNKRYAHYFCKQPNCPMFGKVVQKDVLETKFNTLIKDISPNKDIMILVKDLLKNNWKRKALLEEDGKRLTTEEVKRLEARKKQYMDRIANSTNEALIREYEKEIEQIVIKRQEIESNLPIKEFTQENFGTACDLVFKYIENPVRMWQSPNYKDKRLLLEMYFNDKLTYDLKEGLGTVNLACLVSLITSKQSSKNHLVEMPGFEPGSEKTPI